MKMGTYEAEDDILRFEKQRKKGFDLITEEASKKVSERELATAIREASLKGENEKIRALIRMTLEKYGRNSKEFKNMRGFLKDVIGEKTASTMLKDVVAQETTPRLVRGGIDFLGLRTEEMKYIGLVGGGVSGLDIGKSVKKEEQKKNFLFIKDKPLITSKPILALGLIPAVAITPVSAQISAQPTRQVTKQLQMFAQPSAQVSKLLTSQASASALASTLLTAQSLLQSQQLAQPTRQVTTPITTTGFGFKMPSSTIETKKYSVLSGLKRIAKAYSVQLKKGGVWKPIGKGLPLGKALRLGASKTKQSLSAQFRLLPKGTTSLADISFKPSTDVFREYKISKGRKIPTPLTFIQKRGKRLMTGSERRLIKQARNLKWF